MSTTLKYSIYTKELTKQLKTSERIHCQFDEETREVYVTNGYFLVKMAVPEYDALVRPITLREVGNFVLERNGSTNPNPMDMKKLLKDTANDYNHDLQRAPFLVEADKKKKHTMTLYYSKHENFVAAFNSAYTSILSEDLPCKSKNAVAPMVIFHVEEPTALILPIRLSEHENKNRIITAVRAYFQEG